MSKRKSPEPAAGPAWSVSVAVADVPEAGRRLDLEADAPVREAIAKAAGLVALPRFAAGFDLMRVGDGLRVAGRVSAKVVQSCVVTLEPIESVIDEAIEVVFMPEAALPIAAREEDVVDTGEDPPEPLRDGIVDLGAVATEFLLLGIDPYPRKPGAVFDVASADDPESHPFAALAALKKNSRPDER